MRDETIKPNRRSIRLQEYDYRQPGAYFVTICTRKRECLLGEIVDGKMVLNSYGEIVKDEWFHSAQIRPEIELDFFVVMPNHIHGIMTIREDMQSSVRATGRSPLRDHRNTLPQKSLGSFVAGLKASITKRINEIRGIPGTPFWQRNYYEHVIRNEIDLDEIRQYIENNPFKWLEDENHPDKMKKRS